MKRMGKLSEQDKGRILNAIRTAVGLSAIGEPDKGVEVLKPLLEQFPESPSVHLYLAWYLRKCGRFDEAVVHARHAVGRLPDSSRCSLVLFHSLWRAGEKEKAIDEIRRFLTAGFADEHTLKYIDSENGMQEITANRRKPL
jgi:predicted Zn-dependent protease